MITHLKGKVLNKSANEITIDVNGVGYSVFISKKLSEKISGSEDDEFILTYLDVKENSMTLYGFFDEKEREIFKLLISVSGISCKTAHTVLSNVGFEQIIGLISNKQTPAGFRIPGIGPKKIEMISVALKDKILKLSSIQFDEGQSDYKSDMLSNEQTRLEVLNALINLGYTRAEAEKIIREVLKLNPDKSLTTEELIKKSLELIS